MIRYVVRRVLAVIPILFIVSFIVFGLKECTDTDIVLDLKGESMPYASDPHAFQISYLNAAKELGITIDKPPFYFSITQAAFPDTLHKIIPFTRRVRLENLCSQTGNWACIQAFEQAFLSLFQGISILPDSFSAKPNLLYLCREVDQDLGYLEVFLPKVDRLSTAVMQSSIDPALVSNLATAFKRMNTETRPDLLRKPAVYWYGFDNQYHAWVKGFLKGNWGVSTFNKKTAVEAIRLPMLYSFIINFSALAFSFLLAIPLGVVFAQYQETAFDRIGRSFLIFLDAIPVFVLGSWLLFLFSQTSIGRDDSTRWLQSVEALNFGWILKNYDLFLLPVITITLQNLSVLALQMRGAILGVMPTPYIRTAKSKGLAPKRIYWYHAFRNAVFPIITLFAGVFPALFTGSIIVELMFFYPGMGAKTLESFYNKDTQVLMAILMLTAILTVVGNLVADLMMAKADPRKIFSHFEK